MSTPADAELLIADAEAMGRQPTGAGYWARGAALLARMALETTVTEALLRRDNRLADASMRSKLLLLRLCAEVTVVARAETAWAGLSRACHHHPYELTPTLSEVTTLLADVRSVLVALSTDPVDRAAAWWRPVE